MTPWHAPKPILALLCAWLLGAPVGASAEETGPGALLQDALSKARGGERIELPGGDYGRLFLGKKTKFDVDFPSTVTITSADPADPAVFTELDLRDVTNLTLDGVVFDYTYRNGAKIFEHPFSVSGGEGVEIRNSLFDGDLITGKSADEDGLATAIGLSVRGSSRFVFAGNRVERFFRGLVMGGGTGAVVSGNEFRAIRMDGSNFTQVQDILIENNYFHDFARSRNKKEHSDMIQFWTNGTTKPSVGITIRGNVLLAGTGSQTQSIFMRNDMVDRGKAGREMFYRDILIEQNVIVNGHLHGISVGETDGLTIRGNTILRGEGFAKADREGKVTIPRINVSGSSVRVEVADNLVASVPDAKKGWDVRDNLIVQNITPTRPGYYHKVFNDAMLGNPDDLESYVYRTGGPADQSGLGSDLLRPGADRSRFRPRQRSGGPNRARRPGRMQPWR